MLGCTLRLAADSDGGETEDDTKAQSNDDEENEADDDSARNRTATEMVSEAGNPPFLRSFPSGCV